MHAIFAFKTAFKAHFIVLVFVGVCYMVTYCNTVIRLLQAVPHQELLALPQALCWMSDGYFLFWNLDQLFCLELHALPYGLPNPQFHAWWQAGCAYSIFVGMIFIQSVSFHYVTGATLDLRFRFGWKLTLANRHRQHAAGKTGK